MKKFCYMQDWGSYQSNTFVVVGMTHQEIVNKMKQLKFNKHAVYVYENKVLEDNYHSDGFIFAIGGKSVLWLHDWKKDDEHLGTLVHETAHLVFQILTKHRGMEEETEAQSYQQEYLFTNIQGRLTKAFSKKKLDKRKKK